MPTFNQRITRIKGLSDRRRLPRLGSIRLGIKKKSSKGVDYPSEVDYFVCPEEVQAIYGPQPKELDIMVPINEIDSVFPCSYKYYGSSRGLICQGDGEFAYRVNPESKEMEQIPCPCELLDSGKCKQSASLMVMLPKVSVGGIYQIRSSSYNSIVDIQSGLDYVSALLGRFAMVPLTLRRVKTETHHNDKKQFHYTLQITFDGNIDTLNQLRSDTQRILEHPRYQLPAPKDENPELDPVDIIDMEDEEPLNKTPEPDKTQDIPLSDAQMKKIRAMIGEKDALTSEEKTDCYIWLKENKAVTIEIDGKAVITKTSASDIIENFERYFDDHIKYRIESGSPILEDIPL